MTLSPLSLGLSVLVLNVCNVIYCEDIKVNFAKLNGLMSTY